MHRILVLLLFNWLKRFHVAIVVVFIGEPGSTILTRGSPAFGARRVDGRHAYGGHFVLRPPDQHTHATRRRGRTRGLFHRSYVGC